MTTPANPQRSAQDQFGRLAESYRTSKTHSRDGGLVSAASVLGARRYRTAVDVGAGPGFTAFAIAPYCERVIATDVTPAMLEQVRSLRAERGAPQTEMMCVAAESLPYRGGSIDLVTCRTAAHHFVDTGAWLDEVQRVLSPGGELVLIDTAAPDDADAARWMHRIETWRDPSHVENRSAGEWRSAVTNAGLRVAHASMSRVDLEYPDWAERAGMDAEAGAELGRALADAPAPARAAFGIEARPDGAVAFHWPLLVMKALKP